MTTDYMTRSDCEVKHNELLKAINDLDDRLYKDNGRKSIQSILNEHGQVIKVFVWIAAAAGGAAIISLVGQCFISGGAK